MGDATDNVNPTEIELSALNGKGDILHAFCFFRFPKCIVTILLSLTLHSYLS